jgi:hypothetical protein
VIYFVSGVRIIFGNKLECVVISVRWDNAVGKVTVYEQNGRARISIREELSHHMQTGFKTSGLMSVGFRAYFRGE